jgi:regulator of sigma E protease
MGISTAVSYAWLALSYIAPFIFVLVIVVFVHEFGHFIVGRLCGAGVRVFSFGMGPELIGVTDRQGTRWRISAFPLGGYVRFVGDRNSVSTPDADALAAMPEAERKASLAGQPLPARAAIVAAGPLFNFVLAILLFSALVYANGQTTVLPRIGAVLSDSPAEKAGFRKGDLVKSIDGERIATFPDIFRIVSMSPGETLTILVERDGGEVTLSAAPAVRLFKTAIGPQRLGQLGVGASDDPRDTVTTQPGLLRAVGLGFSQSWSIVSGTAAYVSRIVAGRISADQLSGPVGIARISNLAAATGFPALLSFAAILSVSLGLMNLMPVPLLDGGHLLFYGIEAIRGKPLGRKAQEFGLRIGLAMVLVLVIFVTFNDIMRLTTS